MKKIISLLVALMLVVSATAFAATVPSKTTGDMTQVEAAAENLPAGADFFVAALDESDVSYAAHLAACSGVLEVLAESEDLEEFFGLELKELVGTDTLNVYEFLPLIIGGYEEAYGEVTVNMVFSTPYAKGEKVAVLVGIVANEEITWEAFEGEGVGGEGGIQFVLDAETVAAIQAGVALMAVVSK